MNSRNLHIKYEYIIKGVTYFPSQSVTALRKGHGPVSDYAPMATDQVISES